MNNISFKYAPCIKPSYLDHLAFICFGTVDMIIIGLIVDGILGYEIRIWLDAIAGLILSIFFDFLFSFGKTTINLGDQKVISCRALLFPKVEIKISEIESIHPLKRWYNRCNLVVHTTKGKKYRLSVDDPKRFVALLSKENSAIQTSGV